MHGRETLGSVKVVLAITIGILPRVLRRVWHFCTCLSEDELGVVKVRVDVDLTRDLAFSASVDEHFQEVKSGQC